MINTYADLFFPDRNVICEAEEKCKALIREQTGFIVVRTMAVTGGYGQKQIYLWLDSASFHRWRLLGEEERKAKEAQLIALYLTCFGIADARQEKMNIPGGTVDRVVINVNGFAEDLIGYAYGHALSPLRKWLDGLYAPVHQVLLYMDYNKTAYLLECEPSFFPELEKDAVRIRTMTFRTLKEYDHFDLLRYEDMKMTIRAHDPVLAKRDNDIYMTNYFGE